MALGLQYAATIDSCLLDALEQAGRAVGLSLNQMELLGQDVDAILGFLDAVDGEAVGKYLETVDWDALEARLQTASVHAQT